jgi:hypothetical protein
LELATAVTKYKNREGWRHEDLLRMLHVNPAALKDDGARLAVKYVFACARGEKDFICKLLTDIATSITQERAMELLNTPIPSTKNPEKPEKLVSKSDPKTKTKTKSILAGFKTAFQTVFGGSNATTAATATPAQRKTEIRFTALNGDSTVVEIATSAFGWKRMFMNRVPTGAGVFTISLELPPGTHDFKFIVGGVWQCDPIKPIHKTGEHENNFIVVQEQEQGQQQDQTQ